MKNPQKKATHIKSAVIDTAPKATFASCMLRVLNAIASNAKTPTAHETPVKTM